MSLLCSLGLVTCITVGGTDYTTDQFENIMYECLMAESDGYYQESSYILVNGNYRIGLQDGYRTLDSMEEYGVTVRWSPTGGASSQVHLARHRRAELVRICRPFINY